MNITIRPSQVHGTISAPPSKSITHRAIITSALAHGTSIIKNGLLADDTVHTIDACRALGVKAHLDKNAITIHGSKGVLHAPKKPLVLGNSGTTLRLMTAVAALAKGTTTLKGDKKLQERPMADLLYALRTLGVNIESKNNNGFAPIIVTGNQIQGGKVKISAAVSSQFVSALLLISPFAKGPMDINVRGAIRSKPYIDITLDVMKQFGIAATNHDYESIKISAPQKYKAKSITIEGDYSSASYLLAAAAITGSQITVDNLNPDSAQGDMTFLTILENMGCRVIKDSKKISVKGPKKLKSLTMDMKDHPDLVQTTAVVAAFANGTTHLNNIENLIHKESNRIEDTATELRNIGVDVKTTQTSLVIHGGKVKGGTVNTHNDHRMAMSMAIAALGSIDGVTIKDAEVVSKSYPNFWQDLKKIGVQMSY